MTEAPLAEQIACVKRVITWRKRPDYPSEMRSFPFISEEMEAVLATLRLVEAAGDADPFLKGLLSGHPEKPQQHASDCPVNSTTFYGPGPCDCGFKSIRPAGGTNPSDSDLATTRGYK